MTPLASIDLSSLNKLTTSFHNLRNHRVDYLEPLRRLAHRNLEYVNKIRRRVLSLSEQKEDPLTDEQIDRITAQMLADQDISPNPILSSTIFPSIYLPVHLYFAVLSAYFEFLEKFRNAFPALVDPRLFSLLFSHEEESRILRDFRNKWLNPQQTNASEQVQSLLRTHPSLLIDLEGAVDSLICGIRSSVRAHVHEAISELPPVQRWHCRQKGLELAKHDPFVDRNSLYACAIEVEKIAIVCDFSPPPPVHAVSTLTSHDQSIVNKIGRALAVTLPFSPKGDTPALVIGPPPMTHYLATQMVKVFGSRNGPASVPLPPAAANVAQNWAGFLNLYQTGIVLRNEWIVDLSKECNEGDEHHPMTAKHVFDRMGSAQQMRYIGVGLVAVSVLWPLIREYLSACKKDTRCVKAEHGTFLSSRRVTCIRRVRNEIFHIDLERQMKGIMNVKQLQDAEPSDFRWCQDLLDLLTSFLAECRLLAFESFQG